VRHWVITCEGPGERKHWWGENRSGRGWTPYPGNARQYESEEAARYEMYEVYGVRKFARGEVQIEERNRPRLTER